MFQESFSPHSYVCISMRKTNHLTTCNTIVNVRAVESNILKELQYYLVRFESAAIHHTCFILLYIIDVYTGARESLQNLLTPTPNLPYASKLLKFNLLIDLIQYNWKL